jgi:hypothetical protein
MRNLHIDCHLKTMDTFSNGVVAYAFFMRKIPKAEIIDQIKTDALLLMTGSDFLIEYFINSKLSVK